MYVITKRIITNSVWGPIFSFEPIEITYSKDMAMTIAQSYGYGPDGLANAWIKLCPVRNKDYINNWGADASS